MESSPVRRGLCQKALAYDNARLKGRLKRLLLATLVFATLSACKEAREVRHQASSDIGKLKAIVDLPISIAAVKWEKFEYPEQTSSMLPINYEATILAAELSPLDTEWFRQLEDVEYLPGQEVQVRTWMSSSTKKIRQSNDINLIKKLCRDYETRINSGKVVKGYVCDSDGKAFLFLYLDSQS